MTDHHLARKEARIARLLWGLCILAVAAAVVLGGRGLARAQSPGPLTVAKTGAPVVAVGATQTFAIQVSNTGPSFLSSVTVADPVPANFTVSAASGPGWTCTTAPTTTGTTVTCFRPPTEVLAPGASYPAITIVATAITPGAPVNTATATATSTATPPPGPGSPVTASGSFTTTITQGTPTPTATSTPTATPPGLVTATPTATPPPPVTVTPTATAPPPGGGTIGTPVPTPTPFVILLPPRVQPPPTATPTPTPTVTATPIRTASPTVTSTPASTPAPTPTATPTIAPTVLPTAVTATTPPTLPTPTPSATPALQVQGAYGPITFVSGANPLRVGQTTRIRVTYTVRNASQEPLNFTGTLIFEVGVDFKTITTTETLGTSQIVPAGTGGSAREQVVWTDFVLPPGGSATITAELEATPPAAAAGRALTVFESARITARGTTTGRPVERTEGPLLTSAPSNLATGGIVQPAAPAAPPAQQPAAPAKPAAQAPAAPARPIAQAPAGGVPIAQPPARVAAPSGTTPAALPRSGVGGADDRRPSALIVAAGSVGALVFLVLRRRHGNAG